MSITWKFTENALTMIKSLGVYEGELECRLAIKSIDGKLIFVASHKELGVLMESHPFEVKDGYMQDASVKVRIPYSMREYDGD